MSKVKRLLENRILDRWNRSKQEFIDQSHIFKVVAELIDQSHIFKVLVASVFTPLWSIYVPSKPKMVVGVWLGFLRCCTGRLWVQ